MRKTFDDLFLLALVTIVLGTAANLSSRLAAVSKPADPGVQPKVWNSVHRSLWHPYVSAWESTARSARRLVLQYRPNLGIPRVSGVLSTIACFATGRLER